MRPLRDCLVHGKVGTWNLVQVQPDFKSGSLPLKHMCLFLYNSVKLTLNIELSHKGPEIISDASRTFSSVQFSCSVMSDSLRPHELQQARPPCPSPTPGVHPNSRPSSRWWHPAISSSVVPFSSCPKSLPVPMSQLFTRDGQTIGVSALASFLPKKSQG